MEMMLCKLSSYGLTTMRTLMQPSREEYCILDTNAHRITWSCFSRRPRNRGWRTSHWVSEFHASCVFVFYARTLLTGKLAQQMGRVEYPRNTTYVVHRNLILVSSLWVILLTREDWCGIRKSSVDAQPREVLLVVHGLCFVAEGGCRITKLPATHPAPSLPI